MADEDPRLQAASEAFTRMLDIGKQCIDEGKARWSAALDRQAALLDDCKPPERAPAPASAPAGQEG